MSNRENLKPDSIQLNPAYCCWRNMKQRCRNPKAPNYRFYGGRGITVCPEWLGSFDTFLRDMGPRPSLKHSIDRERKDGNYEPGNCKWATQPEQLRNRRKYTHSEESKGKRKAYARKINPRWTIAREDYESGRMTVTEIAKALGVTQPAVSAAKKREKWAAPYVQPTANAVS